MAASVFAFAKQAFRKFLQSRYHNRSFFNCNMRSTFLILSVHLIRISTTTRCRRRADAKSMEEALIGVARADLYGPAMPGLALNPGPSPRAHSYLKIAFIGHHCLLQTWVAYNCIFRNIYYNACELLIFRIF